MIVALTCSRNCPLSGEEEKEGVITEEISVSL